ncbi:alpha amylase catalytic region [Thermobaculum terrenum ATCC BAA-798]|uniref:Alpha amylase catalytic region n=1 Tax=Thermobaculum terrenum (strain ATCC BAA-798 / CCMEE 7001 / YNP1) TaxID=525904 RepID=D1CFN8_THET1|nr:alpha amylase catalytic region [Thermobaculum terrenum ATCC BAA-798]
MPSRRLFIKTFALAGLGSLCSSILGCSIGSRGQTSQSTAVSSTPAKVPQVSNRLPSANPTTASTPVIDILTPDFEAWSLQADIWTDCKDCPSGSKVFVSTPLGKRILQLKADKPTSVSVRLQPGTNTITSGYISADGKAVGTDELEIDVKIPALPLPHISAKVDGRDLVLKVDSYRLSGSDLIHNWDLTQISRRFIITDSGDKSQIRLSPKGIVSGQFEIGLQVRAGQHISERAIFHFTYDKGEPQVPDVMRDHPDWIDSAVVYGVVPFLFGDPPFKSVTQRLPYLHDLGVNAIWLSPINATLPGDFGYAVVDYFKLREDYGTEEDFRDLVKTAHSLGIKVLMDFVPNHTSSQHPYFLDTQKHGKFSHYYDFYMYDSSGNYQYYFDWAHLPNLNYDNPEVRAWMMRAFTYWVREYDVDGFRVDVAWGIRERRPDFWPQWREELKSVKPDLFLLAEASARDPYYFTHGFDAAYDWTEELGHWAWERVFNLESMVVWRLRDALTNFGQGYHEDALIFRFINNNDTGERFISKYGLPYTKLAATLLLTLPGVPCIYTGDEVGAEYEPYSAEGPISWEDKYGLKSLYQKLIALRRNEPAIHSRKWMLLDTDPQSKVLAYTRFSNSQDSWFLVALNFSSEDLVCRINLPKDDMKLRTVSTPRLILGHPGKMEIESSHINLSLGAYEAKILAF